jgi:hypothetical protein
MIFVDADCQDGQVRAVVVQLHQSRSLLDAGWTLTPPQVQQNDFASIVGQPDGVFAIADGEVGSHAVGVRRSRSPVAASCEGEHHQTAERDETMRPHVSIIRSGRDGKEDQAK